MKRFWVLLTSRVLSLLLDGQFRGSFAMKDCTEAARKMPNNLISRNQWWWLTYWVTSQLEVKLKVRKRKWLKCSVFKQASCGIIIHRIQFFVYSIFFTQSVLFSVIIICFIFIVVDILLILSRYFLQEIYRRTENRRKQYHEKGPSPKKEKKIIEIK